MDKANTIKQMCTFALFFSFLFGSVLSAVLPIQNQNPHHGLIPLLAPNGTNDDGNRAAQYYISPHQATWLNAKRECETSGMKLLAIKSPSIQAQVEFELNYISIRNQYVFTSGNDVQNEGTPVWGDGSRFIFENEYCTGNNIRDDCMVLHYQSSWKWHFLGCTETHRFICEV